MLQGSWDFFHSDSENVRGVHTCLLPRDVYHTQEKETGAIGLWSIFLLGLLCPLINSWLQVSVEMSASQRGGHQHPYNKMALIMPSCQKLV